MPWRVPAAVSAVLGSLPCAAFPLLINVHAAVAYILQILVVHIVFRQALSPHNDLLRTFFLLPLNVLLAVLLRLAHLPSLRTATANGNQQHKKV